MKNRLLVGLLWAVLVSGCGGGGGGGDNTSSVAAASAEGLWVGVIEDPDLSVNQPITALIFDDGTFWVWYDRFYQEGLIVGAGTSENGSFTSSWGWNFRTLYAGSATGHSMSASYIEKQSLSGRFRDNYYGSQFSFTASYDADYELTPSLSAIAGTYSGVAAISIASNDRLYRYESQALTISNSGAISSAAGACSISGWITPRDSGNAYNVTVNITGINCYDEEAGTNNGIAYFDAATSTLQLAATPNPITNAFVYVGTKPQVAQTSELGTPAEGAP